VNDSTPDKAVNHGNYSTYSNHGCRCDDCRRAHNEWHRSYRSSARGKQRALIANRRSRRIQQEAAAFLKETNPEAYSQIVSRITIEMMED